MSKEWIKTADEIDRLRHSCHELARILDILMKALRPGMSTQDIDDMSEKLMLEIGAIPIFKGYMGGSGRPFPATLCTSINEEVVHGIPNKNKIIKEGDLVKLDIGMRYEGMVSDMARTIKIGSVSPVAERLTQV
ncbi:MAG TPA: type I methionyl aminopeptidase, partial [Candidatus Moranbacteria bacterium]|nr:type I methionyl aminopeptidase [Candidatus Moranbacteria bacterium]